MKFSITSASALTGALALASIVSPIVAAPTPADHTVAGSTAAKKNSDNKAKEHASEKEHPSNKVMQAIHTAVSEVVGSQDYKTTLKETWNIFEDGCERACQRAYKNTQDPLIERCTVGCNLNVQLHFAKELNEQADKDRQKLKQLDPVKNNPPHTKSPPKHNVTAAKGAQPDKKTQPTKVIHNGVQGKQGTHHNGNDHDSKKAEKKEPEKKGSNH